jgi:AdoMet-dependent heme synthase
MNHSDKKVSEVPELRVVAFEVTRNCILNCKHCRATASRQSGVDELSTDECKRVIDSIAQMGEAVIILTGGEPMLREDIYEIAKYGVDRGQRMAMAPCGLLLNKDSCQKIVATGISRISLSIDGATAVTHDAFRGQNGAFEKLIVGIDAARSAGLEFQVNTTVTNSNIDELPAIFELALQLGAVSFHPFLLVPIGRGKNLTHEMISPEQYESVLNWIYDQRSNTKITLKPTCAPHYYRILRQRESAAGRIVKPATHGLDAMTKGCLGGQGFAFISHTGDVQICGFLEHCAGSLRKNGYNFGDIWQNSELFLEIRSLDKRKGKCGICEYVNVCGGCRARAFSVNGDYLGEEPQCGYEPAMKKQGK